MILRPLAAAAAGLALMLAACGRDAGDRPDAGSAGSPAAATTGAAPAQPSAAGATPGAASTSPAGIGQVPALRVATIDGRSFDLADRRGKWVVVNFWATWCGPCLKEMPDLSALDAMREHVEVIGLAYEDIEPADMRAFLKDHPVVYPIAIVDVTDPPAAFEVPRGLPTTYLIGPNGRLAQKFLGPVTAHDIEAAIAKAGGPAVGA